MIEKMRKTRTDMIPSIPLNSHGGSGRRLGREKGMGSTGWLRHRLLLLIKSLTSSPSTESTERVSGGRESRSSLLESRNKIVEQVLLNLGRTRRPTINIERDRQTETGRQRQTDRNRLTDRQTSRNRLTDRQTDRDRQTGTEM